MTRKNKLSLSQILDLYRSSFRLLIQRVEVLHAFFLIFLIHCLMLLPSWLQYHASADKILKNPAIVNFFAVFALNNPYQFLSFLLPTHWDYLFVGFFRNLTQGILFFFLIPFQTQNFEVLRTFLIGTSVISVFIVSFLEGVFLLWLKDKLNQKKATFQQLLDRGKTVYQPLVVTNLFLLLLHFLPGSSSLQILDFTQAVQFISTAQTNQLIFSLLFLIIWIVIYTVFFSMPFLIVDQEQKDLKENFLYIRDFLQKEGKTYAVIMGVYLVLAVVLNILSTLLIISSPIEIENAINPVNYGGLLWQLCLGIVAIFSLGTLVVTVMRFVRDHSSP